MIHTTRWLNLKMTILNEKSKTQKAAHYMILLICYVRQGNLRDRNHISGCLGRGGGAGCLKGTRQLEGQGQTLFCVSFVAVVSQRRTLVKLSEVYAKKK